MDCLVVIPAYNEAQNIEKVVDNIINNYPQYDYVIVNDGSTDNCGKICDEYAKKELEGIARIETAMQQKEYLLSADADSDAYKTKQQLYIL